MPDDDDERRLLVISCADAVGLMTDHLEGALSPSDAARLRGHLEHCEACRVFLDQLRATVRVVRDAGPEEEFAVDPARVDALVDLFRANRDS